MGRTSPRALLMSGVCLMVAVCGCSDDRPARDTDEEISASVAVHLSAAGCGSLPAIGSGAVVERGVVATVAHVVAGAATVEVTRPDGSTAPGTVVAIDRRNDVALVAVDTGDSPVLALTAAEVGDAGVLTAWRDGSFQPVEATVTSTVGVRADDVGGDGRSVRSGHQLSARIVPGDSGAIVVASGAGVAMVFARSRRDDTRAWATSTSAVAALLAAPHDAPVDVGACP